MERWLMVLALACAGIAGPVAAAYKWIDKDGNVQYSDKPPPGVKGQEIKPPPAVDTTSAQKKFAKAQKQAAAADAEKAEAKTKAAKSAEESAARKSACEQARHAVERLTTAQRIYQSDDAGNRVRLGAEEVEKRLAEARKTAAENCK